MDSRGGKARMSRRTLALTIPQSILLRANTVIE